MVGVENNSVDRPQRKHRSNRAARRGPKEGVTHSKETVYTFIEGRDSNPQSRLGQCFFCDCGRHPEKTYTKDHHHWD